MWDSDSDDDEGTPTLGMVIVMMRIPQPGGQ